jgi:tetratricopeptide (TPR) repeat protein
MIIILAVLFRDPISSWLTRDSSEPMLSNTVIPAEPANPTTIAESISDMQPEPLAPVVETSASQAEIARTEVQKDKVVAKEGLVEVPDQLEPVLPAATANNTPFEERQVSRVMKSSPAQDKRARAESLYDQLVAENGPALSLSQMEQVLAIDPDFHKVRMLWLSRLSQSNQAQFQIEIQRAISNYTEVFQYRQMLARTMVVEQPRQAYELLTADLPTIRQAPDYHGLIAYSAKQMGDYNLASRQYQLLLSEYPERSDWWLALGVTEEQLGKTSSALAAYQQSLRFPGLAANTRAWAQQRITALQGF